MDKKVKFIASKEEDITSWYTDVCLKAELMDYAKTKGFIIYRPDGYAIWEEIQSYFNSKIKNLGVRNVYLPSLIPMSLLNKEKEHIQGFAPECAIVTKGGNKTLAEEMVIRPTSETLFCDYFKNILHSYNDLPIKNNQWCSVVRWEKTTRPFLRGAEFLWQEGHTLHSSEDEARQFALEILKTYRKMGEELLAIPFIAGRKTDSEKFAGAKETYTIETLMPDNQALQCGTSHYFGTEFCENFNIKYQDKNNKLAYPYYTSWGISTRLIGALVMLHGDDNGLVLPPKVAPTQVVIIPIKANENKEVNKVANKLYSDLNNANIRTIIDNSDKFTPGFKFAKYELKGVPLRIEIGPKDLENNHISLTYRYSGEKKVVQLNSSLVSNINKELDFIQTSMYKKALESINSRIITCNTKKEIEDTLLNKKGFAKFMYSDTSDEENYLKEKFSATPRVIPFDEMPFDKVDPITNKKADKVIYYSRAY